MEKLKINVCPIHERIQKFKSKDWMNLTPTFRDYLFVRNEHRHEEVDSFCDRCYDLMQLFV